MPDLVFPADFLWGTAVAAHQVEGGNHNDWTVWESRPGTIADGSVSGKAVDHYNLFREDIAQLAADGHTSFRFSIEWSRIEPREGHFDAEAIAHYAEVIATCRKFGIEPLVTLQHFTLPQWLASKGGIMYEEAPKLFARYAKRMAEEYGSSVQWWTTINEPNVLAELAYQQGMFPPGKKSVTGTLHALSRLVRMHAAASRALREVAKKTGNRAMMPPRYYTLQVPRMIADGSSGVEPLRKTDIDHFANQSDDTGELLRVFRTAFSAASRLAPERQKFKSDNCSSGLSALLMA